MVVISVGDFQLNIGVQGGILVSIPAGDRAFDSRWGVFLFRHKTTFPFGYEYMFNCVKENRHGLCTLFPIEHTSSR